MQVIGHPTWVNDMVRRMIVDELFEQMALDFMDLSLPGGLLKAHFAPFVEKERKFMKKAWKIFKKCVAKENNLDKFLNVCNENEGIFLVDIVARVASIGKGIGYLYH